MQTIVEPKEYIEKLWGKQRIKGESVYRMMRYVLKVEHDGKVLLHNVVTGRLVVLELEEAKAVELLPLKYNPVLEELVAVHYLVPEDYDEHQQVLNLRNILWKMVDAQSSEKIMFYTILPTTACNAHCWYCYEKGIKPITMTEEIADEVASFIIRSCGGKPIKIRWFGGEPTLAASRIDQISRRLQTCGIMYTSIITTNGYLFDAEMVHKAKNLWHTTQVNISVDGTEETFNRVKAFSGVDDNPYQRMMNNVGLLLREKIAVVVRMNYDKDTWQEFSDLLEETRERFKNDQILMVHAHQINTTASGAEWAEKEKWLNQKNDELDTMACIYGNYRKPIRLPELSFIMCSAGRSECCTIRPDGQLVSCPERLDDDQVIGNVWYGLTNVEVANSWKRFADYERCKDCTLYPFCARMNDCASKDHCSGQYGLRKRFIGKMVSTYENYMNI